MKKRLLFFIFFIGAVLLLSGQHINGVIYYQNSGGKTVSGVQVSAASCNSVYSQSNGMFRLNCTGREAGQRLDVVIGTTDGAGNAIEVVNTRQLEWLRIPHDPDHELVKVIVCPAGQLQEAKLRFNGILRENVLEHYEKRLATLEKQRDREISDAKAIKILIAQIEELHNQRDAALAKAEVQAAFIARINRDQASELVQSAIQTLEEEEDIDAALDILDDVKLEASYALALEDKRKVEARIQKVVEGFELKIKLLLSKFKYEEAIPYYERIIEIYEINNVDKEKLATVYYHIANACEMIYRHSKALDYHQKAIALREVVLDLKHPDLAISYNNIADVYESLKQYEKALEYNLKVLGIKRGYPDTEGHDLASAYGSIAITYRYLGQYKTALKYHQKAIDILEDNLGAYPPSMISDNNIKTTFIYDYKDQSKKNWRGGKMFMAIKEDNINSKYFSLASNYINIAITYKEVKNFQKAIAYQERSIAIYKKIFPEKNPFWDMAPYVIVRLYESKGDHNYDHKKYHQAIKAYQKAIEIHPEPRTTYLQNDIGLAYAKNKQFKEAHNAFTAYEKLFPKEGRPYRNWAMYYALQGDKEKALVNLQKAVELGYDDLKWLSTDDSMDSLRNEIAFKTLIQQLEEKQSP